MKGREGMEGKERNEVREGKEGGGGKLLHESKGVDAPDRSCHTAA